MRNLFLIFMLLLVPGGVFANAYVSQQDGLWSRASNFADSPWFDGGAQSVWASFPQATDTFNIAVGHTVLIDGDITVGDTALNDTTYDNVIDGNLVWPAEPGGVAVTNWTFSTSSSILIQGVGKFYIGCSPASPTDRLDCDDTATVEFLTGLGINYDIRIAGASAQLLARGCEGYPAYGAGAGTETRARITACNPDCNIGANRTLTLDTNVNWQGVTNPATDAGTGNPEVIIGGGGSIVHPGWLAADYSAELTEIDQYPAANQVRVTALAKNHVIGDMIVNPTKNILFRSSSVTNHGSIYSTTPSGQTEKPFMVSWVRLDEMGDAAAYNTAGLGVDLNATTSNFGTIDYTWATNCGHGVTNVNCFYILEGDFDSFDWNGAHDPGTSGKGMYMANTTAGNTVTGFTAIDIGGTAIPQGTAWQSGTNMFNLTMDQMWVSNAGQAYSGSVQAISNSVFHHFYSTAVSTSVGYTYERHKDVVFENNEVRNCGAHAFQLANVNVQFTNNDMDNIRRNCLYAYPGTAVAVNYYSANNTFDNCHMYNNQDNQSAMALFMRFGHFYSQNDDFGSTHSNARSNIYIDHNAGNANTTALRVTINDPILNAPFNPVWIYPIYLRFWDTNWLYRYAWDWNSFASIHNENQVAGAHTTFGPGGMIITHTTGAGPTGGWVDGTVNMKVIPYAADRYCRVSLGKVRVESGDVLTVDLQIQKNQAIATGRRPRLVLKGSGFDSTTDYDEMADVNDTWDAVSVSGTATYDGGVHLYLEILNDLEGNVTYPTTQPVDPPTIVIYADGFAWTIP